MVIQEWLLRWNLSWRCLPQPTALLLPSTFLLRVDCAQWLHRILKERNKKGKKQKFSAERANVYIKYFNDTFLHLNLWDSIISPEGFKKIKMLAPAWWPFSDNINFPGSAPEPRRCFVSGITNADLDHLGSLWRTDTKENLERGGVWCSLCCCKTPATYGSKVLLNSIYCCCFS